jgi:hypothetical protein
MSYMFFFLQRRAPPESEVESDCDPLQLSPESMRRQEEYFSTLPSTSTLAKSKPASVYKNMNKKAKTNPSQKVDDNQIKSEELQYSYMDATIEDETDRRKSAENQIKSKKKH